VMTSVESLHLLSFHDLVDMSEFLKTSGVRMNSPVPLQQLARLGPSAEKDAEPLKILARYMTKKNFVRLADCLNYHPLTFNRSVWCPHSWTATLSDICYCSLPSWMSSGAC
jgi:hypothetical protein